MYTGCSPCVLVSKFPLIRTSGERIPWGPVVRTVLSLPWARIQSLVREPQVVWHGQKEKNTNISQGFPGSAVVKDPPANAGDTGSSPGPGRSHMPRSN